MWALDFLSVIPVSGAVLAALAFLPLRRRATTLGAWRGRRDNQAASVVARPVMTGNELDFFATLRAALPDAIVLAQVSFGAIIEPRGPARGTPAWWSNRHRFGQKVADYVVLDADGRLRTIVELDDCTHDRIKDSARDALLASAGIAVVRYDARAKPDVRTIRQDVGLDHRFTIATPLRWLHAAR